MQVSKGKYKHQKVKKFTSLMFIDRNIQDNETYTWEAHGNSNCCDNGKTSKGSELSLMEHIKYYPLSDEHLKCYFRPLQLSDDEQKAILNSSSMSTFITGRSGTGKTSLLTMMMCINEYKYHLLSGSVREADQNDDILRQVFVTSSPRTCNAIKEAISGYESSNSYLTLGKKKGEYPLVVTLNKVLRMMDATTEGEPYLAQFSNDKKKGKAIVQDLEDEFERQVSLNRFKSFYWPLMKARITKKSRPEVVFSEIITVIKGSVGSDCLSRTDYVKSSNGASTLDLNERSDVYNIFMAYENLKTEHKEFDIADLVNSLHRRKIPQIAHHMFVDDIEELSLKQLEVLIKAGEAYHVAGQQLMSESLNFKDLRVMYFKDYLKYTSVILKQNFRSHARLHNLSKSLVEMICYFFPGHVDEVDEASTPGPMPHLLLGDQNAFIKELCGNPNSIVLVRSLEKESNVMDGVSLLPIIKAKGLDFQDVVLFNYFKESPFTEWSLLYRFMAENGFSGGYYPTFSSTRHSPLCDELKMLFVAVTRCRNRLFIVEENDEVSNPLLLFWIKKKLVEVAGTNLNLNEEPQGADGTSNSNLNTENSTVSVLSKADEGASSSFETTARDSERHNRQTAKLDWDFIPIVLNHQCQLDKGRYDQPRNYTRTLGRIKEAFHIMTDVLHNYPMSKKSEHAYMFDTLYDIQWLIVTMEKLVNKPKRGKFVPPILGYLVKKVVENRPKVEAFLKEFRKKMPKGNPVDSWEVFLNDFKYSLQPPVSSAVHVSQEFLDI